MFFIIVLRITHSCPVHDRVAPFESIKCSIDTIVHLINQLGRSSSPRRTHVLNAAADGLQHGQARLQVLRFPTHHDRQGACAIDDEVARQVQTVRSIPLGGSAQHLRYGSISPCDKKPQTLCVTKNSLLLTNNAIQHQSNYWTCGVRQTSHRLGQVESRSTGSCAEREISLTSTDHVVVDTADYDSFNHTTSIFMLSTHQPFCLDHRFWYYIVVRDACTLCRTWTYIG